MSRTYKLIEVAKACKVFRMEQGYTQSEVAEEIGYSVGNVSAFEQGRNDSISIFMWYLDRGFTIKFLDNYLLSIGRG